jgi:alanine-glyoxylate transaminase/(R)-3-amino-2-methylpropionate-pyruvate transaminase
MELCKDRALLIGRGGMAANTIHIKPPFCITNADTDFIIKAFDEFFSIIERANSEYFDGLPVADSFSMCR